MNTVILWSVLKIHMLPDSQHAKLEIFCKLKLEVSVKESGRRGKGGAENIHSGRKNSYKSQWTKLEKKARKDLLMAVIYQWLSRGWRRWSKKHLLKKYEDIYQKHCLQIQAQAIAHRPQPQVFHQLQEIQSGALNNIVFKGFCSLTKGKPCPTAHVLRKADHRLTFRFCSSDCSQGLG